MKERHRDLSKQHQRLRSILLGHYAYYGRRSNSQSLGKFFEEVKVLWKKWLSRRSNNGYITWEKMKQILKKYPLPPPRLAQGKLGIGSQIPLYGEFI